VLWFARHDTPKRFSATCGYQFSRLKLLSNRRAEKSITLRSQRSGFSMPGTRKKIKILPSHIDGGLFPSPKLGENLKIRGFTMVILSRVVT